MCPPSKPKQPASPPAPQVAVAQKKETAQEATSKQRKKMASKTGGSSFRSRGYGGVIDTLLGNRINRL